MMLICREQASAGASSQGTYLIIMFEQDALEGRNCTQKIITPAQDGFSESFLEVHKSETNLCYLITDNEA